jgi:phosphoglucomutase
VIADRANELLRAGLDGVRRVPFTRARAAAVAHDFLGDYVDDLPSVLDLDAVRAAGVRIGADPLGGPASTTGARSPSGTASTSPSSTRWSTPPGGS